MTSAVVDLKQEILRKIVSNKIGTLLWNPHLKADVVCIFVGERGGGKSGSAAVLAIVDYMLRGVTCYSNMNIGANIIVDDHTAQSFGLRSGGVVSVQSLPLDLPGLLRFDEKYRNSCILVDEINVELSEARRSMSNTNLFSNRLAQEIRHLNCSLIGTTLSEMFIDSRLRDICDLFIKCEESAYLPENLAVHKPRGIDFVWNVYFMNKCFTGENYSDTKKPGVKALFHFKPWRGCYNDKEFQGEGMTKYGVNLKDFSGGVLQQGKDIISYKSPGDRWSWLPGVIEKWQKSGLVEVPAEKIWFCEEAIENNCYQNDISEAIFNEWQIKTKRIPDEFGKRHTVFIFGE